MGSRHKIAQIQFSCRASRVAGNCHGSRVNCRGSRVNCRGLRSTEGRIIEANNDVDIAIINIKFYSISERLTGLHCKWFVYNVGKSFSGLSLWKWRVCKYQLRVLVKMRQGLATEPELHRRHHGFEVVNMELDADDLEKDHDESYQMDHEEVEDLFKKLDKNNDGRIDLNELAEGLKHLHGSRYKAGQAQVCTN